MIKVQRGKDYEREAIKTVREKLTRQWENQKDGIVKRKGAFQKKGHQQGQLLQKEVWEDNS